MDIKRAFDHILKSQLLKPMIKLDIDGNLIAWIRSFLIEQKILIIIDEHKNKEREIETDILKGSLVAPILFLKYISRVFDSILQSCISITLLLFFDDLGFIALGSLVKDIVSSLRKIAEMILEWGKINVVTYDTAKIEAILFFYSHRQQLNDQL